MTAAQLPDEHFIAADVARALQEDLGAGDVSAALVADRPASVRVIAREDALLCGSAWFERCFRVLDPNVTFDWQANDGARIGTDQLLCTLRGGSRALLSAERSALNFLQTLSATATETARYAAALAGTRTRILDTRKTLPGLRRAQKYAVACGGGCNHRFGLYDAVMLKENHIAAAGSIAAAMHAARQRFPELPLIVEVESRYELAQALEAGVATRILLDDFSLDELRLAVADVAGCVPLEVSGGVTFERLREIAETGVDFVSIGALTKNVRAIDLSMRFQSHDLIELTDAQG